MARYILIDNYSGYIFGDTADLPLSHLIDGAPAREHDLTPALAARWLDEAEVGDYGRTYTLLPYAPLSTQSGYLVYRADVDGSDAVPVVQDGQDAEAISAVVRDCEFVGFVAFGEVA